MTDTHPIIEVVARELAFNFTPLTPKGWEECRWPDDWDDAEQKKFRGIARAALTAALDHMMEPSEAMCDAAPKYQSGAKVWQAMLSQLRKEVMGDE